MRRKEKGKPSILALGDVDVSALGERGGATKRKGKKKKKRESAATQGGSVNL